MAAQATPPAGTVNERQRRLAEITEMIHTASLMHDDVMDHADTVRGAAMAEQTGGAHRMWERA
jgi:all-trans-nonaprenyl-diphosphate synthase